MKIHVRWVGIKWHGKRIDVEDVYVREIAGWDALNILYNQDSDPLHKDHNLVILYERTDMNYLPEVGHSSMSVAVFSSERFKWFSIDKEYLLGLLEK